MPSIKTTLLAGSKPSIETMSKVLEARGLPPGYDMQFMVFEVKYDHDTYYCCWAGGEIRDGEPLMTLIGQAATQALLSLPLGHNELLIQELRLGKIPLRTKVMAALRKAPPNSKVCFLGDMQGELDGHMAKAFNLTGQPKTIAH